jgi:hypothetical protein
MRSARDRLALALLWAHRCWACFDVTMFFDALYLSNKKKQNIHLIG